VDVRRFSDFATLSEILADHVAERLKSAIGSRGLGTLVVPGGTTPAAFFDVLCARELPWEKVTITLTDERWVSVESERSNEYLVRGHLLKKHAAGACFVPLKTQAATVEDGEREAEARVAAIARPFDVIIAGMGDDGHTFSWIPGAKGLRESLDEGGPLVRAIAPPPSSHLDARITLTLRAACEARWIALIARGESKWRAYEAAIPGRDVESMPVRALFGQSRAPVAFYWSED